MEKSKKPISIMALLGGSSKEDDPEDMDSGDLALKAAYEAILDEDFEGFRDSMKEWYSSCSEHEDTEEDSEDDAL